MKYGDVVKWKHDYEDDHMMVLTSYPDYNAVIGAPDEVVVVAALNVSRYDNGDVFEKYASILEVVDDTHP